MRYNFKQNSFFCSFLFVYVHNLNCFSLILLVNDIQDIKGRKTDEPLDPFSSGHSPHLVEFSNEVNSKWLKSPINATNDKSDERDCCKNLFHLCLNSLNFG